MHGIRKAVPAKQWNAISPRRATLEEVALVHDGDYIDAVRQDVADGAWHLRTGDTELSPGSLDAALMAVGGVFEAVDAVFDGRVSNAFCVVRPPGHHATPDRGMGFCIFNNIALGARYALKKHGIKRVLIADWDVHHGNGTQDAFYHENSVFFFSTHQWPFYPGTGTIDQRGLGDGKGFTLNCPCAMGSGNREVVGAFRHGLIPAMREFEPELVMVSAGFDGRVGDLLGGFVLTDDDFAELTGIVRDIADTHAEGRLVSCLEGGYELNGLASAAGAHVKALSEA